MNRVRKWWKAALALILALIAFQVSASLLVRTVAMRSFLTRQLEKSFGRPVEVRTFSAALFPTPQLDAYGISVGEDPAFGREYFLRAERLSAGLRWLGLLRGQFELGTLQLDRPSLILGRNAEGLWNLERWLPNPSPRTAAFSHQTAPSGRVQRLQKIEISDGRVNFKLRDDKSSFAFISVAGSVEQMEPDRWRMDLQAQPWRSGIPLQLAGTVWLRGDVAGTSARLQPAHLQFSWENSSLADIFRLFGGRDFGVRGTFSGEAAASSDAATAQNERDFTPGDWKFSIRARAASVHRWDLTERDDDPRIGIRIEGKWNPGLKKINAREIVIETPRSHLRGTASLDDNTLATLGIRLDSASIQAADVLDWYRAFHPGIAEGLAASQFFSGTARLRGWPLSLEDASLSSSGGRWTVPGFGSPMVVRTVHGSTRRGKLEIEPVSLVLSSLLAKSTGKPQAQETPEPSSSSITLSFSADLAQHTADLHLEGQTPHAENLFRVASAFGHPFQRGWELNGEVAGDLHCQWGPGRISRWNGRADLTRAKLQFAGLNQPVQIESVRAEWRDTRRKFTLAKVAALGANWTGTIEQTGTTTDLENEELPLWSFQLQADHLDAVELDRWIGPRARPNWLQRLLPSSMSANSPPAAPSAFLKRIRASGDLRVDQIAVAGIELRDFRAHTALEGPKLKFESAQAQWAGGAVQGAVVASFSNSPNPTYEVSASFDHIALTQTPWLAKLSDHLAGTAEGSLDLRTNGIGRDALLKNLSGKGELRLSKIELRGWDLPGTMAQGEWKTGVSRWNSGIGTFHISDGGLSLNTLRLASPSEEFLLKGSVSFSQDADLTAESHARGHVLRSPAPARFLTISGPLNEPKVSLEKMTQQPGD